MNTCQKCRLNVMDAELVVIEDVRDRVKPGEPMPSGQCPECGGLCLPDKAPLAEEWLNQLLQALNQVELSLRILRGLMIGVDAPPAVFAVGGVFSTAFEMFKRTISEEMGLVLIPEEYIKSLQEAVLNATGLEELEEIEVDGEEVLVEEKKGDV